MRYLAVHYSADPAKDAAWAEAEKLDTPARDWDRQMEMREDVYDGQPVYADFVESIHAVTGLRALADAQALLGGWDCGATLIPAYVDLQITSDGQVQALFEIVSEGGESMESFAPQVLRAVEIEHPLSYADIDHQADATVTQRSGTRLETAQQVAAEIGIVLTASSNVWQPRISAVTWLLKDRLPDGRPRFVYDRLRCPILHRGFQGAYKLGESKAGDSKGAGRVLTMPVKNGFSHVHDALQYPAMKAQDILQGRVSTTVSPAGRQMNPVAATAPAQAPPLSSAGLFKHAPTRQTGGRRPW